MSNEQLNLENLIQWLKKFYPYTEDPRPEYLRYILCYTQLVEILEKINAMIGMESIKSDIAARFRSLTVYYAKHGTTIKDQTFHTLLLADPGMGKTQMGAYLAEFWTVTGCLRQKPQDHTGTNFKWVESAESDLKLSGNMTPKNNTNINNPFIRAFDAKDVIARDNRDSKESRTTSLDKNTALHHPSSTSETTIKDPNKDVGEAIKEAINNAKLKSSTNNGSTNNGLTHGLESGLNKLTINSLKTKEDNINMLFNKSLADKALTLINRIRRHSSSRHQTIDREYQELKALVNKLAGTSLNHDHDHDIGDSFPFNGSNNNSNNTSNSFNNYHVKPIKVAPFNPEKFKDMQQGRNHISNNGTDSRVGGTVSGSVGGTVGGTSTYVPNVNGELTMNGTFLSSSSNAVITATATTITPWWKRPETRIQSIFRVLTRADFISRIQGGSTYQLRKLLKECEGGCIMIDEAYSMVTSDDDSFGKETLAEIVSIMSTYDCIMFIFAGYKESIDELTRRQPGLKSRFNYTYEIQPYTEKQLFDIFNYHCKIMNVNHTITFDNQFFNIQTFPAYGRDIRSFVQICHQEIYNLSWFNLCAGLDIVSDTILDQLTFTTAHTIYVKTKNHLKPKDTHCQEMMYS